MLGPPQSATPAPSRRAQPAEFQRPGARAPHAARRCDKRAPAPETCSRPPRGAELEESGSRRSGSWAQSHSQPRKRVSDNGVGTQLQPPRAALRQEARTRRTTTHWRNGVATGVQFGRDRGEAAPADGRERRLTAPKRSPGFPDDQQGREASPIADGLCRWSASDPPGGAERRSASDRVPARNQVRRAVSAGPWFSSRRSGAQRRARRLVYVRWCSSVTRKEGGTSDKVHAACETVWPGRGRVRITEGEANFLQDGCPAAPPRWGYRPAPRHGIRAIPGQADPRALGCRRVAAPRQDAGIV